MIGNSVEFVNDARLNRRPVNRFPKWETEENLIAQFTSLHTHTHTHKYTKHIHTPNTHIHTHTYSENQITNVHGK